EIENLKTTHGQTIKNVENELAALKARMAEKDEESSIQGKNRSGFVTIFLYKGGIFLLLHYKCPNCGDDMTYDTESGSLSCSSCGHQENIETYDDAYIEQVFADDEEVKEYHCENCGAIVITDADTTANRIENITGMYVPFWIYDINSKVEFRGTGTKVRTYSRGDYIYTETKYYDIYRKLDLYYSRVPADASEKMADDIMDKLEPYH